MPDSSVIKALVMDSVVFKPLSCYKVTSRQFWVWFRTGHVLLRNYGEKFAPRTISLPPTISHAHRLSRIGFFSWEISMRGQEDGGA